MKELIGKKGYIFVIALIFVTISLFSTTYSLFIDTHNTNEFTYKTGLLDLVITSGDTIKLADAFPISDTKGMKGEPYTLTIKNTGSLAYMFDIKMQGTESKNVIDDKYIKVMVNNDKPVSLGKNDNLLKKNILIYPNEEITFNLRLWLDSDTPNDQLGKYFQANIITNGVAFYKTLDNSGANHPILYNDMIPVYYDEDISKWKVADASNLDSNYEWYNYDNQKWANIVKIKDSDKYIYDISENKNNILINKDIEISSGEITLDNNLFGINTNLSSIGSIITRFRLNEIGNDNTILSFTSGNLKYDKEKFILSINGNVYESEAYKVDSNKYYILSYTVSNDKIVIYINGDKIFDKNSLENSNYSVINYGIDSNITISDIYVYDKMLDKNTISSNFKNNIIVLEDNLVLGYNDFYPRTLFDYYKNSDNGTIINDNDINEFFVWIPRFKYRVWNVLGDNSSSYDAYTNGIDITFEQFNYSSGTIYCNKNICYSNKEYTIPVTNNDNNKYYTHLAFTSLDKELYGVWVSKYELSSNCQDNSCLSNKLSFQIIPNGNIWNNNYLSNYYRVVINRGNNYHIIKNTEWGAVAYLSYSKYGICREEKCEYMIDSTTNNIYGIYNMNSNYSEFVMANYATNGNDLSLNNSHFNEIPIVNSDYDLYYKDSFILGDATKELPLNNSLTFLDVNNNWFIRGSNITLNNSNGIFYYSGFTDDASENITTRVVIR